MEVASVEAALVGFEKGLEGVADVFFPVDGRAVDNFVGDRFLTGRFVGKLIEDLYGQLAKRIRVGRITGN